MTKKEADELKERINSATAGLQHACEIYCGWYDHGKPEMSGDAMAYELVSAIRQAMARLKGVKP